MEKISDIIKKIQIRQNIKLKLIAAALIIFSVTISRSIVESNFQLDAYEFLKISCSIGLLILGIFLFNQKTGLLKDLDDNNFHISVSLLNKIIDKADTGVLTNSDLLLKIFTSGTSAEFIISQKEYQKIIESKNYRKIPFGIPLQSA